MILPAVLNEPETNTAAAAMKRSGIIVTASIAGIIGRPASYKAAGDERL